MSDFKGRVVSEGWVPLGLYFQLICDVFPLIRKLEEWQLEGSKNSLALTCSV